MSMRAKFDGGKFYNRFQNGPLNIDAKVQAYDGSCVLSGTLQLWKRSPTKELDLFSKPMLLMLRQTGRMTPDNKNMPTNVHDHHQNTQMQSTTVDTFILWGSLGCWFQVHQSDQIAVCSQAHKHHVFL